MSPKNKVSNMGEVSPLMRKKVLIKEIQDIESEYDESFEELINEE